MKSKLAQVNQSYKKALGQILVKEFPEIVELTVVDVLIDPSYTHGRVWLRTSEELLEQVEKRRGAIQSELKKYVQTRYTPKLSFHIEEGYIDKIDGLFEEMQRDMGSSK